MKLVKTFSGIGCLWHFDHVYVKLKKGRLYKIDDLKLILIAEEEIESFTIYEGYQIYQIVGEPSAIYILNEDGPSQKLLQSENEDLTISRGLLISGQLPVFFNQTGDIFPGGMYLIGPDLSIGRVEVPNVYNIQIGQHFFNNTIGSIFSYGIDHSLNYKLDISGFGTNVVVHRETGEILSKKSNEIDGELFASESFLYVPLRGGQLLAVDAATGEQKWLWEHDRLGAYGKQGDIIYKQDGKSLYVIDALNGDLIKSKRFSEEVILIDFHASGPIWIYQDVIIVVDVLSGKVCILDILTLNALDYFTINKKIPFDLDALTLHEDKLYILDLENTLYVFEQAL